MALQHDSDSEIAKAVRKAGSQSAFARLIGKNQSTVYEWLKAGRIPADEVSAVATATGIPKEQLRPDLYRDERMPEPTASDILDRAAAHHDRAPASMDWKR